MRDHLTAYRYSSDTPPWIRIVGLVCGLLLFASSAEAALIVVNNTADVVAVDGSCGLREAIDNANLPGGGDATGGDCAPGAAGTDVINLPPGLFTISIAAPPLDDLNLAGDLDILDSVTIAGSGAGMTMIDAQMVDRALDVAPNFAAVTVQLAALSIRNGRAAGVPFGGGARISPSALIEINDCAFRGNEAGRGGGIHNSGEMFVSATTFDANRATGDAGGGLFNEALAQLTNCTLDGNRAVVDGGGIANRSTLILEESSLSQNEADVDGGGLSNFGDASVRDTEFLVNTAAARNGGGIYHDGTDLDMVGGTLQENDAADGGGGIYSLADASLDGVTLSGNSAIEGGAVFQGGGALLVLAGCRLHNNEATIGGGIRNLSNVELNLSELFENVAQLDGGGIYNNGDVAMSATTIRDNQSLNGRGGGVFNQGTLEANHSIVAINLAEQNGGGLNNETPGSFARFENCTVSRNQTQSDGGGVFNNGSLQLDFTTVARNETPSGLGGGIANGGTIAAKNTIVGENSGDCLNFGAINSAGYNLDSDTTCFGGGFGDLTGVAPGLGPLQGNGGPTETHALLPASAAIDSAEPACTTLFGAGVSDDQRFIPRPLDGNGDALFVCDRGAFEAPTLLPPAPPPVPNGTIGTALRANRANLTGTAIEILWDVALCPGVGYHLIHGPLSDVSTYTLAGGVCGVPTTGTLNWGGTPAGDLYFMMLADDGSLTEGSWGSAGSGIRNGATASGECGFNLRDNAGVCP